MATSRPLDVSVASEGERLSGLLFLPEGAGPHPAVVLAGGWCYVKEIVQPITRRPSPRPASPRSSSTTATSAPARASRASTSTRGDQIEDYQNAISFLEARDDIDADRLGVWGISYSGGHVLILGAVDPRVRAVARSCRSSTATRTCGGRTGPCASAPSSSDATPAASSTTRASTLTSAPPRRSTEVCTWPFPQSRATFAT